MTERIYYDQPELMEFDACIASVSGGDVVLDRTAFYPTSGGQTFDTGWLSIGADKWRVADVRDSEDGSIVHAIEGPAPEKGTAVHGLIDVSRRRDHMQQHTGQHVLSAAFIRLFNMPTVSFHMGDESCSIDLDTKSLSAEQVQQAEKLANETVFSDVPVTIRYATPDEARSLGLRKIPAEVRDKLRLIDIQNIDLTACGGTHVSRTGQIGPILLRKTEKVRQGMRVEFVCGLRAVNTSRRDFQTLTDAAGLLSAHIWDLPAQVRKLMDDGKAAGKQQFRLLEELAELLAARLLADTAENGGFKLVKQVFPERDLAFIKLLAQKLTATPKVVTLLGCGSGQPALVFAQSSGGSFDMGALMKEAMAAAGGRGGGSRDLAQGGAPDVARLAAALEQAAGKLRG